MRFLALSSAVLLGVLGCAEGSALTGGSGPGGGEPEGGSDNTGGAGGSPSTGGGPPSAGGGPGAGGSPATGGGPGAGGGGPSCGDGSIDAGETCDGQNLGGETCMTQGFDAGTLACNASCTGYDTSLCMDVCTPTNLLTNGGFENGPNGGGWTEASLNFGTPVCDTATCGTGGGTGPSEGSYWVWIGGTNAAFESASVTRSVVIPPGMATLTFQFDMPSCESPAFASDSFTVRMDGNVLFSRTNSDPGCGAVGYELVTLDVSAYANGASHTLRFEGQTDDFFAATNFFVDDVRLIGCQ